MWRFKQPSTSFVSPAGKVFHRPPSIGACYTCRRTVRRQHSGNRIPWGCWRQPAGDTYGSCHSLRASIRGITVLLLFCKAFLEGEGVLVDRSTFLIPSLPKGVWLSPILRPRLEVAAFLPGALVSTSWYNLYLVFSWPIVASHASHHQDGCQPASFFCTHVPVQEAITVWAGCFVTSHDLVQHFRELAQMQKPVGILICPKWIIRIAEMHLKWHDREKSQARN